MENILFKDLGLSENILKALNKMGFASTTPVQGKAIVPMMQNRDITVQAPTGTGKTCAFGIPVIELVDTESRYVQALILCPTRELAVQTSAVLQKLVHFKPGVRIAAVYGGERIEKQLMALRRHPQIVVATPGRMMDHLRRKSINISQLKAVVLDEADRMLDMGFREDLNTILETVPQKRQTALFSATFSPEIMQIAKTYQKDAHFIRIEQETLTVDSVEQFYTEIRGKNKTPTLIHLLREKRYYLCLVFVATKSMAGDLAATLSQNGFKAEALHGDLRQRQRDIVMDKFRRGLVEVLVATDVAARGIDVTNIDAVINYDIPQEYDSYVHRIGRTGRADQQGVAYTFIYPKERQKLREIMLKTHANILPLAIGTAEIQPITANAPLPLQAKRAPLSPPPERPIRKDKPKGPTEKSGYTRIFISLGNRDNITPAILRDVTSSYSDIPVGQVGKISIYDKFSFLDIPSHHAKKAITDLSGMLYNDRTVIVEAADRAEGVRSKQPYRKKPAPNRRKPYKAS